MDRPVSDPGDRIWCDARRTKATPKSGGPECVKPVRQGVIALPVPFPECGDHKACGLSGAIRVLLERGQHPVARALGLLAPSARRAQGAIT